MRDSDEDLLENGRRAGYAAAIKLDEMIFFKQYNINLTYR